MPRSILWMPKISWHSYDIAVVAVRQDHTSSVSILKGLPTMGSCVSAFFMYIAFKSLV